MALNRVTLNLSGSGSSTLTITHDTKPVKDAITDFVNIYNETRDFLQRTRNAKADANDQFGLMFSDSLLRSLFNDVRSLTTSGVKMAGAA